MKLAILLLAGGAVFAADEPKPISKTETFDFAANGTIHLENSTGELDVEGWDEPRVELTTVRTAKNAKLLDRIRLTARKTGDDLTIASELPKRKLTGRGEFTIEYQIKAPRTANLVIDQESGEVNIRGITGDIRATDRHGDIALVLPEGRYTIDAKSRIGSVISDFPGKEKRDLLVGQQVEGAAAPASKLYLRVGFGDIIILKIGKVRIPS